jgi:hypothetical protein
LATLSALLILGAPAAPLAASREELSQYPTIDALAAEERALRAERPEQWEKWTAEADKFYADHAAKTFPWRKRGLAPLPQFQTLNFPLAFLAAQLRRFHSGVEPGPRNRLNGYLEAVVLNPDPRRARFLDEYGELHRKDIGRDEGRWDGLLARAAGASWAAEKLRERLVGDLRLWEHRLPYMLLERFAEELPADVVAAGYGYVYAQGQQGGIYILNEAGVEPWKLLLRLDRERALSDIVALHENRPPDAALLSLLIERAAAVPDARLAKAAARWLSDAYHPGAQFKNVRLLVLMLKSSPDAHLPTVVGRVHKLVGVSPRHGLDAPAGPDEIEMLIATLLDVEPARIANAQTRAMHQGALTTYAGASAVRAPVRLNILKWMAKNQHPDLAKVIARWLAVEPDSKVRERLREHAETEWGDYGREALRQAERINSEKGGGRQK